MMYKEFENVNTMKRGKLFEKYYIKKDKRGKTEWLYVAI